MASFQNYLVEIKDWNIEAGHLKREPENIEVWNSDRRHRELAVELIEEEVRELRQAVLIDDDPVETLDALGDILFTVFGLAAKSGHYSILEEALAEICASNWTKLDGEPVVLESGKIGKAAGYKAPKLDGLVRKAERRGFL